MTVSPQSATPHVTVASVDFKASFAKVPKGEQATLKGRIKIGMAAKGIKRPIDLAKRMRLPRQTIHSWLNGARTELTPALLFHLADTLGVNPRWLALGPPNSPVPPRALEPDDEEMMQIKKTLDAEAREHWISAGRQMVRLTAKRSIANPFPAKE